MDFVKDRVGLVGSLLAVLLLIVLSYFFWIRPPEETNTVHTAVPPDYRLARNFSDSVAAVRVGEEWGYIDPDGRWVLQPRYEAALDFRNGRAPVRKNGRWGYVNNSGTWVVEPVYDRAQNFSESRAAVKRDGRWAFLDRSGDTVTEFQYTFAESFRNDFAIVQENNRKIFIDRSGRQVFDRSFEDAGSFSHGVAPVERNDLWGYVNRSGELVVEYQYQWASPFHSNRARVLTASGWELLDDSFSSRDLSDYDLVGNSNGSVIPVIDEGEWSLLSERGDELSGHSGFEGIVPVERGPVPVRRGSEWGYVNENGSWIVEPRFDALGPFVDGRARVKINGRWGYLAWGEQSDRTASASSPASEMKSSTKVNLSRSLVEQYPRWFYEPGQRYVSIGRGTLDRRWHLESTSPTGSYGFDEVLYEVTKYPYEFPGDVQHEAAEELYFQSLAAVEAEGWLNYEKALSGGYEGNKHDATHFHQPGYSFDTEVLVPSRPEYLIYYGEGEDQRLKGFMYLNSSLYGTGPQIGGPLTLWHYHRYSSEKCFRRKLIIRHGAEECSDGEWQRRAPEMLHIWFMNHPQGSHGTRMEFLSDQVPSFTREYRPKITN